MSDGHANTIRSRRVVLPEGERPASIVMHDGVVERIGAYEDGGEDLGDLVVLPGLIDPHVHVNEPGRTEWEGFETATRAAAAGGITLIADMPLNSSPVTTSIAALDEKQAAAMGKLTIDVAFHGGLVRGNADVVPQLVAAGVTGIKVFLCDSGLEEFPSALPRDILTAMRHLRRLGVPLLAHAEHVSNMPPMKDPRSFTDFLASRPRRFEQDAVRFLIEMCSMAGAAVHIVHLADAQCLPMLREARRAGLPVTVETCPHYLFFDPAAIPDGATLYKCTPPLRGDGRELLQALLDGDIDLVASDHSPCPPEMKLGHTRFDKAWGGISSLQLGLSIMRTVGGDRVTPSHIAQWMSRAPAKLLGLSDERGELAAGKRADMAVVDWDQPWRVDAASLHHRHPITPYDKCGLVGVVRRTYLAGRCAFKDGRFMAPPTGTIVRRPPTKKVHRLTRTVFNAMPNEDAVEAMKACCGATTWCEAMAGARPFASKVELARMSEACFDGLTESDWREAFAAHPKIGDLGSLRMKYAGNQDWSADEQAGINAADDATLQELAAGNAEYESRFGCIFIVCAAGKSASQMLELLRSRLHNKPATELAIAATEQRKITRLRIDKLFA